LTPSPPRRTTTWTACAVVPRRRLLPLSISHPLSRPLAAVLLAVAATACAHRPPSAASGPVPVVSPAAATEVLGEADPAARPASPAAHARGGASAPAPRTFAHTPGVTWDLDVLPYEGHQRVQRYVGLFTGPARGRFTDWLSRGTRYDGMVRAKLRAGGLPEDLYYLALVESGFEPHAVSHAGAVGMWQFMAETARDVGLRVDWWVDERRDPVRATDAAVRMMKWLRGQFGSLFVAAAAYNGGPGRVSRGIAQLAATDAATDAATAVLSAFDSAGGRAPAAGPRPAGDARFFALADAGVLHTETVNYVPQLIAAALVAKEADRHGLRVRRVDPLAYDEVRVPPLTPLAAVAAASRSGRDEILDLNPHLLRGMTPPGAAATVRVPDGRGRLTAERLPELGDDARRAFRRLATRKRESYEALADRAGVSVALVRTYNPRLETVARGKSRGRLVSGQAVRLPTAAVLAYARGGSGEGGGPGVLPPLPAPPPEAAAKRVSAPPRPAGKSTAARSKTSHANVLDAEALRPGEAPDPGAAERPVTTAAEKAPSGAKTSPEKPVSRKAPGKTGRASTTGPAKAVREGGKAKAAGTPKSAATSKSAGTSKSAAKSKSAKTPGR
jgi:membrane-bound lytic murein transglycosylase D